MPSTNDATTNDATTNDASTKTPQQMMPQQMMPQQMMPQQQMGPPPQMMGGPMYLCLVARRTRNMAKVIQIKDTANQNRMNILMMMKCQHHPGSGNVRGGCDRDGMTGGMLDMTNFGMNDSNKSWMDTIVDALKEPLIVALLFMILSSPQVS